MSAPVDVLAVLDALCERAASGDPAEYREVNSLRDAVTELIETDEAYDKAMKERHSRAYLACAPIKQRRMQQRLTDACNRRNKALARVKGA